jgi:hypothetical protein
LPHWSGGRCSRTVHWANCGHRDASPPAGTAQVAVRSVLATGNVVGLGCCRRTGLVDVAPNPCLGRTGGTVTPRLRRHPRRWRFGVYSQLGMLSGWCAVAALDCDVAPEPCIGLTVGTGTPRLLRKRRRWRFGVCSQRGMLSGWGAVAALDWWTLIRNRALGELWALGRLASCGNRAGGGSVCARNGECCRVGVLLPHWTGGR